MNLLPQSLQPYNDEVKDDAVISSRENVNSAIDANVLKTIPTPFSVEAYDEETNQVFEYLPNQ